MREVQETQHGDCSHTGATAGTRSEGILADPDGVTRLYFDNREVGVLVSPRADLINGHYKDGSISIEWRRWRAEKLLLTSATALLFLSGATMQDLVEPYVLLHAQPRPSYDPNPGLEDVVLAEILSAPEGLSRFELLALLLPEAREG